MRSRTHDAPEAPGTLDEAPATPEAPADSTPAPATASTPDTPDTPGQFPPEIAAAMKRLDVVTDELQRALWHHFG